MFFRLIGIAVIVSSPEPRARVSYCHSTPSLRPSSVNFSDFRLLLHNSSVSAKFIGPSDRQDKYVIGPICLISSRTEMTDVASNTMYTMYTQSQTDISSVLWNDSANRTECPMKFHKVSRTLTACWILMKLGKDEVLMVPYKCCCFFGQIRPGADPGRGKNRSRGSPSSTNFFFRLEGYSNKPNA